MRYLLVICFLYLNHFSIVANTNQKDCTAPINELNSLLKDLQGEEAGKFWIEKDSLVFENKYGSIYKIPPLAGHARYNSESHELILDTRPYNDAMVWIKSSDKKRRSMTQTTVYYLPKKEMTEQQIKHHADLIDEVLSCLGEGKEKPELSGKRSSKLVRDSGKKESKFTDINIFASEPKKEKTYNTNASFEDKARAKTIETLNGNGHIKVVDKKFPAKFKQSHKLSVKKGEEYIITAFAEQEGRFVEIEIKDPAKNRILKKTPKVEQVAALVFTPKETVVIDVIIRGDHYSMEHKRTLIIGKKDLSSQSAEFVKGHLKTMQQKLEGFGYTNSDQFIELPEINFVRKEYELAPGNAYLFAALTSAEAGHAELYIEKHVKDLFGDTKGTWKEIQRVHSKKNQIAQIPLDYTNLNSKEKIKIRVTAKVHISKIRAFDQIGVFYGYKSKENQTNNAQNNKAENHYLK